MSIGGCAKFFALYDINQVPDKVEDILQKEYHVKATVKIVGHTLWVYEPIPFSFLSMKAKQEKFLMDRLNNTLYTIARVLWSSKPGINFYAAVFVDISTGLVVYSVGTTDDLKSYYFERISIDEFTKRRIYDRSYLPSLIGDSTGENFHFFDISLPKFLAELIAKRAENLIKEKNPSQKVSIYWDTNKNSYGSNIFSFKLSIDSDLALELTKKVVKEVLSAYNFQDIAYITITAGDKEETLIKDDVFPAKKQQRH